MIWSQVSTPFDPVSRGVGWEHQDGGQLAHILADLCSSSRCQAACLCFTCCFREGKEGKGVWSTEELILPTELLAVQPFSLEAAGGEPARGW